MQTQAHVNISRKNAKGMFCVEKSRNFYDISEFRLPRSSYSRSTTPGFSLGFFFFLSEIRNQSSRGHNNSTFCHFSEPKTRFAASQAKDGCNVKGTTRSIHFGTPFTCGVRGRRTDSSLRGTFSRTGVQRSYTWLLCLAT